MFDQGALLHTEIKIKIYRNDPKAYSKVFYRINVLDQLQRAHAKKTFSTDDQFPENVPGDGE
jgi:hypothetical protein